MTPRVSVFTGLHAPGNQYVAEAHQSLLEQVEQDWEWCVVENNGGRVPDDVRADKRVRVGASASKNIGAVKRRACAMARADSVVELDADDMLTPDALGRVADALEGGADFAFSDFADFHHGTWQPHTYGEHYGWKHYPFKFRGHDILASEAPPLTPQNIRFVYWCPNHVRAWRAETYWRIGGHDPLVWSMDDHDLVVRFVLAEARVEKIPACLYLYRIHAEQTVWTRNGEIQENAQRVYEQYCWKLAARSGRVWTGRDTSCKDQMAPGEWLFLLCPKADWYDRARIPLIKGDFHLSKMYDRGFEVEAHLIRLGEGYEPMGEVAGD